MPEMFKSGEIFAGRYRIEHELGRGGLGVVYACEHIHTGQKVALKLLLTDPRRAPELEAVVREKFRLEQRVWSHAPSEHIVRVLDAGNLDAANREAGEGAAGTLYIVMELLHGDTLQRHVERLGVLPPADVVHVLQQIARGLDEAHGCRGPDGKPAPIVHRDLTPKNIILSERSDGSLFAKLLDFGIAKQLVDGAHVTEALLGTRVYTAPEQILGRAISAQTDVWAFGLIAYYALAGCEYGPPHGPALVRPSQRLRQQGVEGRLPEAFDRWFLRCLDQEPERRFASAGEAAAELALALTGAEALVPARPSPSARRMEDPVPLPLAVQDTAASPVSTAGAGTVKAVAAALFAEPQGSQLGVTVRLQPGAVSAPNTEPFSVGQPLTVPEGPRRDLLTPASALAFDTESLPLASAASRPFRWGQVALVAAALAGGSLYFAWAGAPEPTRLQDVDPAGGVEPVQPSPEPATVREERLEKAADPSDTPERAEGKVQRAEEKVQQDTQGPVEGKPPPVTEVGKKPPPDTSRRAGGKVEPDIQEPAERKPLSNSAQAVAERPPVDTDTREPAARGHSTEGTGSSTAGQEPIEPNVSSAVPQKRTNAPKPKPPEMMQL